MPGIMNLYSLYHKDGLIGSDIIDLIKLWSRIPNNAAFIQLFLPEISAVIQGFWVSCYNNNAIEI